jgi:hypothetical protein
MDRLLYYKTNFEFSQDSKKWILDRYKNNFDNEYGHNYDVTQLTPDLQKEWRDNAGKELLEFLSAYNCNISELSITAHICNKSEFRPRLIQPHIDFIRPNGVLTVVNTRFNILILGNPEDEMIWWTSVEANSNKLKEVTYINPRTNASYNTLTIPGNLNKKLEELGDYDFKQSNLLTPSAFVRTDCMHTLSVTPGPRLVVTVGFNKTIEELIGL